MGSTSIVVCDGHLHLYDQYQIAEALSGLFARLAALGGPPAPTHRLGLLTEASGCNHFRRLSDASLALPESSGMAVWPGPEAGSLAVHRGGRQLGFLIAGRQIVTQERIEVLAIGRDAQIPDGLPTEAVLDAIRDEDAVPVLPWAPGKWFGARGSLVRRLIGHSPPDRLLLGDSGLRPTLCPTPPLLRSATRRGFRVIAGSDPLPFAGDEVVMGTYGFRCAAPFDPARPVTSLKRLLTDAACRLELAGRRTGVASFARRWLRHRAASRRRGSPAAQRSGR